MHHHTDSELLRQYAANGCDEAFAALVRRHINLVYSTALRITRSRDLAHDVTQAVFVILCRKARSLSDKTILTGWLYRTARFASTDALRSMRRREQREQEAIMIQTTPDSDSTWEEVAPLLERAMNHLPEKDRNLVLLRYFENKSLKEVGILLGITDDTAQKRIARGLDKLRNFFSRHSIDLTAAALASLLSTQAVQAAPAASATAIFGIGSGAMTLSSSTATIVKGTLHMLIGIQLKNVALLTLALLIVAGAFTFAVQNGGSQTTAAGAAITPLQALERLAGALRNHDPKTFLSVVHAETPKGIAL